MRAEAEIKRDPKTLAGLLEQFRLKVVHWYFQSNAASPSSQVSVSVRRRLSRMGANVPMSAARA